MDIKKGYHIIDLFFRKRPGGQGVLSFVMLAMLCFLVPQVHAQRLFTDDQEYVEEKILVIGHLEVASDSLRKKDLFRLFVGDVQYWKDDTPVTIIDFARDGRVRDSFYDYLGKTSSRIRSIWLKRKLSGEGELPISVKTEAEVLEHVITTEGAIGFVKSSVISEEDREKLKVLIDDIPLDD